MKHMYTQKSYDRALKNEHKAIKALLMSHPSVPLMRNALKAMVVIEKWQKRSRKRNNELMDFLFARFDMKGEQGKWTIYKDWGIEKEPAVNSWVMNRKGGSFWSQEKNEPLPETMKAILWAFKKEWDFMPIAQVKREMSDLCGSSTAST